MKSLKEFVLLTIIFPIADKLMGTCAMKWYGQIKLMNTWSKEQIDNCKTSNYKPLFAMHMIILFIIKIYSASGLTLMILKQRKI